MDRQQILDDIEEIQERNNETFIGSNEAELHTREDIADYILKLIEKKPTKNDFKKRVISMITHIPDISEMQINPSVFSDDFENHDCDTCPQSIRKQGDTFDPNVCLSCWEAAIINCPLLP